MRRTCLSFLLILAVAIGMTACGGGSNALPPASVTTPGPGGVNPGSTPQVLSGVFVDAPVEGLTFVSGAQTGATDAAGVFKFEAGGTVQFKVGNVILGEAPAKALMTPVDLVKSADPTATETDARVAQIVQFLMTVNANAGTAATMTIPPVTTTAAQAEVVVDLSRAPANVPAILGRIVPTKTPVATADATAHIQATIAALTAPKAGLFAAVDSTLNPTLGVVAGVTANPVGNAFIVSGKAVNMSGATWNLVGTMTTDGAFQATGTGTGPTPAANMTIAGAMTSATQLTATANFTLNGAPKTANLTFEKAVVPLVAAIGKFGPAADIGVPPVAGDFVHVGAGLIIKADGSVDAHLVQGQITGVVALAPIYSTRYAGLTGIVTTAGNIIAVGGIPGDPDVNVSGEVITTAGATAPSVVIFTGALNGAGTAAAVNMTATDLTTGLIATKPVSLAQTANAFAGVYKGTHSDTAPGLPSTFTFSVNNDNTIHGFCMFLRDRTAQGRGILQTPFLLDGTVAPASGTLTVPAGFNIGNLGAARPFPGLVMTDQEGVLTLTPGTFAGSINPTTGVTSGTWQIAPAPLTTGTFAGNLVP